jgi:hypothetical protein
MEKVNAPHPHICRYVAAILLAPSEFLTWKSPFTSTRRVVSFS